MFRTDLSEQQKQHLLGEDADGEERQRQQQQPLLILSLQWTTAKQVRPVARADSTHTPISRAWQAGRKEGRRWRRIIGDTSVPVTARVARRAAF